MRGNLSMRWTTAHGNLKMRWALDGTDQHTDVRVHVARQEQELVRQ